MTNRVPKEKRKQYKKKYESKNCKRVSFRLFIEDYNKWKTYSEYLEIPFATMVRKCVEEAIENYKE